jgi:photosystem II stability/assembly factor-like uncharacterized protein
MKLRKTAFGFLGVFSLSALVACGGTPAGAGGNALTPAAGAVPVPEAGPPTSDAGTPYKWDNVVILGGGFVTGTIFSPAKKDLFYARTDVGGAYRWDPAAKRWIPLTDHFERMTNYMGIESIAPDPVDPNVVYAALGTYSQSWAGNGAIARSRDQGNTWEITEMTIKMGGNELGRSNGERLAVDPNQTKILFFGSRRNGLWKSEDGAVTWKKVPSFPITEDPNGLGIPFVVFDAKSGQKGKATPTIYAGVSRVKEPSLYKSTDAGATWKALPNQPTKFMPHHLELDSKGTVYVVSYSGPGPHDREEDAKVFGTNMPDGAVYKFEPKAGAWTDITPVKPNPAADDKFGYGGLSVDAKNPGTLIVSTLNRYAKGHNIYRTTDGGKTWKDLFAKSEWDIAGAQYLYWHRPKLDKPHWMGDVDIDPFDSAHMWLVTGAGLWRTTDATNVEKDQPTHWRFTTEGLEETVVTALVSPPKGPELFSGVGDICGFRHDDVTKPPATGMFNPPFNFTSGLDFAESKPDVVVRVGTLWNPGKHGAVSQDGGKTWTEFATEPAEAKTGGAIAISPDASTLLWIIKKEQAVFSNDLGKTWTKSEGLPVAAGTDGWVAINVRPAADRVNPSKFYVYDTADGFFFVSTDGGKKFEKTVGSLPGLPDYARASGSLKTVPGFEGHIWLTTGKEVMRSTDSGKTFQGVASTEASHAIGFGAPGPNRKYPAVYLIGKVGGKEGFYRSDDIGNTWVRINDDKHQYGFTGHITGDPKKFGRVYVGTGGRGILYGDPK